MSYHDVWRRNLRRFQEAVEFGDAVRGGSRTDDGLTLAEISSVVGARRGVTQQASGPVPKRHVVIEAGEQHHGRTPRT